LLHVLASISEFENDLRKDRQMQGIDLAKRKGIKFGRKHSLTEEQVLEVKAKRDQGTKIVDLMSEYKISKASIYRALSQ
jgi:DNA invertase Pin-like site-specific DNA recombinase